MRRPSNAFTLIEVMVAVVLSGLAAVLASATFGHVRDSSMRLARAVEEHEATANLQVLLSELFARAQPGSAGGGFSGGATAAEFDTFVWSSRGGEVADRVSLSLHGDTLILAGRSALPRFPLAQGVSFLAIDYLAAYGSRASFQPIWDSRVSVPLGVRLRLSRLSRSTTVDTLLFWVGSRL